jgi:hypothetical protein
MQAATKRGIADDVYWATLPPRDCVNECKERCNDYVNFLQMSGRLERWQRNYSNYYGAATATPASSNKIGTAGSSGEYTTIMVNDYRNLLTHLVVLTTQGRPALKAKASNTDVQSRTDTIIADTLLENALSSEHVETDLKRCVELALLYDEAFELQLWDANLGEDTFVDPDTDQVVHAGDVDQTIFAPCDVARDVNLRSDSNSWLIFRLQKNRYDLAAQFPAFKDEIIAAAGHDAYLPGIYTFAVPNPSSNNDLVDCFLLLHKKTPALPQGRLLLYLGDEALIDGPLPYDELPVGRIAPAEQDQTPFGYSNGNDLLSLQEGKDALMSIILSNEVTFGGQNIATKKGSGLTWSQLGEGFNLFEVADPKNDIVPLQLTKTAPEIFNFVKMLDSKQTQLSGLNDTVRGNPQDNIQSGSAMALIQAQAIQFISGLQESYTQLLETWGNHRIWIYQKYANEKRVGDIAGKANAAYMKSFMWNKDDIKSVKRVKVEVVSALSKTYAGKLTMAQDLLKSGRIDRPDEYFTVIETGRLEPLFHDELADLIMIASENEALQENTPVQALITDLHKDHILAHRSLLNDPETRINNHGLRDRVQAHILEHIQLAQSMSPIVAWATNNQLPPPPAPPGLPPGAPGPGGPPQPGQAPRQGLPGIPGHGGPPPKSPGGVVSPEAPVERQAEGVALPAQPKVAGTNQRAPGPGESGGAQ